jgi:hypothetical protein
MWNTFLQEAEDEQVWRVLKYTGQKGEEMVKALRNERGELVTSWDEKAKLIKQVGFPKPLEGIKHEAKTEGGFTHLEIRREEVNAAIFEQSVKKAAGPDRINFKAIRLLWGWDEERVVALVKTAIRLGHHPKELKTATGVVIPKPAKSHYHLPKAYRVVEVQNCLGKVIEKVVATKIADDCERKHLLHDGQFGCRKRRSAIDAVGRMIQRVEEA